MKLIDIVSNLQAMADHLGPILESDGKQVLTEAIEGIKADKQYFDKYRERDDVPKKPIDWGYNIGPNRPLRFKLADDKGRLVRPDIICSMRWDVEVQPPVAHDLVLRVWSTEANMMCREDWDSEHIQEVVTSGKIQERVMLRCHFDLANLDQAGPRHHMQIGGNPQDGEYGWYPKELNLPRICHYPLDLVLLLQLTAANFFPSEYQSLKQGLAWKKAVKSMEQYLLPTYFNQCIHAVAAKATETILLDSLWNI